jgi:hypothetical protein
MTATIRFKADDVELDPQVGFIGFADSTSEHYFWMQLGETEDGLSPNKDEIWLERDDQQWGGHGSDWRITLTRHTCSVDTRQLPWMACNSIEIEFSLDDGQFQSLKELLQAVMLGCSSDLSIKD